MSVLIGLDRFGLFVDGAQEAAYVAKVSALSPIAYWILGEHEGTVAYDQIDPANQNGTHVSVTLGNAGIGDGQVCPLYDGSGSYTNVYSAALAAAFSGAAGTVSLWLKVSGAGVWTDGTERRALTLRADAQNRIIVGRSNANNTLRWAYEANNVLELVDVAGYSAIVFFHMAMTWDIGAGVNGEMKGYYNGVQAGTTQTALGVWAGGLSSSSSVIGSLNTVPQAVTDGYVAHVALWDSALTPAQVGSLAVP